MKKKYLFAFVLGQFFCQNSFAIRSYFPKVLTLNESEIQFAINNDVFVTEEVWDNEGKRTALGEKEGFTQAQSELALSFGVTNELQLTLGVRGRYNEAQILSGSDSVGVTTQGLESALFGLIYHIKAIGNAHLGLEMSYRKHLYENKAYNSSSPNDFIVLGDEEDEQYIGGIITYHHPQTENTINFTFGYRDPGDSLSEEAVLALEGVIGFRRISLLARGEVVLSLNNDPLSDSGQRTDIDNSPSRLYNSSNREWAKFSGGINFAFTHAVRLELRGGSVTSGQSTDKANFYAANLVFRTGEKPTVASESQKFKEYSIEGEITKISQKKKYFVINQGLNHGVYEGMKVDVYRKVDVGKSDLLATGNVIEVQGKRSIVKINKFYDKKPLKKGDIIRGGIISGK